MTEPLILGTEPGGSGQQQLDVDKLIGQHACLMAMSGGGKSGLIRKIAEVVHGRTQVIILDPEDEFYTLREKFDDYLIAGGEGSDCPAKVANAAALATMLLETGMNAVIQLNDLSASAQEEFVAAFVTALMEAPRSLWHPLILVIDEAHRFAPQEGWAASGEAVRELTSRGRKRGYTAVLATQRMAKINKNVTGDVTHWFIGRVGQATDRKVAADQLGFAPSSPEAKELQTMAGRHFYAFGPALAVPARMFRVADTITTIVKAGQARLPTPPAPEAMREIMAAMAAAAAPPPEKPPAGPESGPPSASGIPDGWLDPTAVDELVSAARAEGEDRAFTRFQEGIAVGSIDVIQAIRNLIDPLYVAATERQTRAIEVLIPLKSEATPAPAPRQSQPIAAPSPSAVQHTPGPGEMMKMKRATVEIIAVYEKVWPRILPWISAAKLAGVGLKSSQFRVYEPEAVASGQLERIGDGYRARKGVAGGKREIIDAYRAQLSPAFRAIFDSIARAGVPGQTRAKIMEEAGVSPTSSTTSAALRQMQDDLFVEHRGGDLYGLTEAFQ